MWIPKLTDDGTPLYRALADALAADVASGRLAAGAQLPPQRELARRLRVDLTTITRGYAEARRRGLIAGHVGRGTFVRPKRDAEHGEGETPALVDLSTNLPPEAATDEATRALATTLDALRSDGALSALLDYQPGGGRLQHRVAGARWIARRFQARAGQTPVDPDRIVICSGAQHALTALLTTIARPGDLIAAEQPTYPGFLLLCHRLKLRIARVVMDDQGMDPKALRKVLDANPVKAIFCTPTLQNPTTAIMTLERREALARIARRFDVPILEDDVYGPLARNAPPPIASLSPAPPSYFIGSLSKALAPGLRTAFVTAPTVRDAERLATSVRATVWMTPPLTTEIAARWIVDGTADRILDAARRDIGARHRVAVSVLGAVEGAVLRAHPEAFHAWLELPEGWTAHAFAVAARRNGVVVTAGDAFVDSPGDAPRAVRLSLGAPRTIAQLELALHRVARTIADGPPAPHTAM